MSFLSPWTALLAAAIALPVFIALYILRLRRTRLVIPSTLLWRQVTRDLEVNAPIRKLRTSLLFFLQLLLLATLVAAIGEPAIKGEADIAQRVVILIDRSASMNAADAPGQRTRLEHAKTLALGIVDSMSRRRDQGMAAVLAFGASAEVIQNFSTSRAVLRDAIAAIEPTDEEADFAAALDLAGSFAAGLDEDEAAATEVVIISDGGVMREGDAGEAKVAAANVRFVLAGPSSTHSPAGNIGFVNLSARRDAENPATCIVFARLISTFPEPVTASVTLRRGSEIADVRSVTLPPAETSPGEATLTFTLDVPDGELVTIAHNQQDVLPTDDRAAIVIPAPRRPRVLLIHAGPAPDPYVEQLLTALEPESLRVMSANSEREPDALAKALAAASTYDLVVFDRVTDFALPSVPSLCFGSAPDGVTLRASAEDRGERILSWDRQHPLLRHVSLDSVLYAGVEGMTLPEGAVALARGASGPVIATMNANGARDVLVAFALRRSNWPRDLSIALFMQNALEYLWVGRATDAGLVTRPGEPVTVRPLPSVQAVEVSGPQTAHVPVEREGTLTLPVFRRAGVYEVTGAAPPMNVVAVATLSDLESDVRTREAITVNARPALAGSVSDVTPRPIWTWFLLAGLGLVAAEWILFLVLKRT